MGQISVAVCTFGDQRWPELARDRAIPSIPDAVPVISYHGDTLAHARNEALARVKTEFVVFLDADDELEPGYCESMEPARGDLHVPRVRYVHDGKVEPATFPRVVNHDHLCTSACLEDGNWIVIGACARTDLIRRIGGFRDYPIWEDWSLWLRCHRAGADIRLAPGAVYRAHVGRGRNTTLTTAERRQVHAEIRE